MGADLGGAVRVGEGVFLGLGHSEVGVDGFFVGPGWRGGHRGWRGAPEGVGHEADGGVLGPGDLGGGDGVCVALLAGGLDAVEQAAGGDGLAHQAVAAGGGFHHEIEVVGVLVGLREAAVCASGCGDVLGGEGDLVRGGGCQAGELRHDAVVADLDRLGGVGDGGDDALEGVELLSEDGGGEDEGQVEGGLVRCGCPWGRV